MKLHMTSLKYKPNNRLSSVKPYSSYDNNLTFKNTVNVFTRWTIALPTCTGRRRQTTGSGFRVTKRSRETGLWIRGRR